jgi:hypothetical protein
VTPFGVPREAIEPQALSFKVEVIADSSGTWCSNALRFKTEDAAKDYGQGLFMRWTAVREWRVAPSIDEPTEDR